MWSIPTLPNLAIPFADNSLLLLNILVQTTVLAALVLVIGRLLKKQAAMRYAVLFPAMLCLLLVAGASTTLQLTQRNLLAIELPAETTASETAVDLTALSVDIDLASVEGPTIATFADPVLTQTPDRGSSFQNVLGKLPLALIILVIWVSGFFFFTIGIMRSLHHVEKLANRSTLPSPHELTLLKKLARQLGGSPQTALRISDGITSPVITGFVRPAILIPKGFIERVSEAQLREVLIHEFAHITRRDTLSNFLQKVVLAIFWFHPLVHLIDRQVSQAREEICDNHVLQQQPALQYGETLFAINALGSNQQNSAITAHQLGIISRQWKLEDRIRELLDTSRSQSVTISTKLHTLFLVSLTTIALSLAGCQLQAAEDQTPEQRIAELENQTRELQEERNRLAGQAEALREQLNQLSLQEERVEAQSQRLEEQAALVREQMSRSLAEIRLLLQSAEMESQLQDIRELTERILRDVQARLGDDSQAILGEPAAEAIEEVLDDVANNEPDRQELLIAMGRLQTRLHALGNDYSVNSQSQRREPTPIDYAESLGDPTYRAVRDLQILMSPEDDNQQPDWVVAKQRLDLHIEMYWDEMNDFEKSTILGFYINYWLAVNNYGEALNTFEEILELKNLGDDLRLRTLRSLGQLYAAEEQWQESINNYLAWRDASSTEDIVVFKGLSYANYQLEQFSEALPYWQQFMALSIENGDELGRDDYAYLNGLYFTLEMFEEALENTKQMIVLFNHPTDWRNLRAIHDRLGMTEPPISNQDEASSDV